MTMRKKRKVLTRNDYAGIYVMFFITLVITLYALGDPLLVGEFHGNAVYSVVMSGIMSFFITAGISIVVGDNR